MILNRDTLIKQFNNNQDLNFIGIATCLQHANAIDACIAQFKDKGIELKGYVLILSHFKTGCGLSWDCFINITNDNIVFVDFVDEFNEIKKPNIVFGRSFAYRSVSSNAAIRTIYVASTYINYAWICLFEQHVPSSKVNSIILDDGSGTYANQFKNNVRFTLQNYPGTIKIRAVTKLFLVLAYEKQLTKRMKNVGRVTDNRLFFLVNKDGRNVFCRNDGIAPYYDKIYASFKDTIPKEVALQFEHCVVVNTQCFQENNITHNREDYYLYKEFICYLKEKNVPVVIKPHPREVDKGKYQRFGVPVYMDNKYSQESIIGATKKRPFCVVSIFSSTLLNIYGIFGIPAISLAKIMKKCETIDAIFKEELEDYIELYQGTLEFPETLDEAVQRIQTLMEDNG